MTTNSSLPGQWNAGPVWSQDVSARNGQQNGADAGYTPPCMRVLIFVAARKRELQSRTREPTDGEGVGQEVFGEKAKSFRRVHEEAKLFGFFFNSFRGSTLAVTQLFYFLVLKIRLGDAPLLDTS